MKRKCKIVLVNYIGAAPTLYRTKARTLGEFREEADIKEKVVMDYYKYPTRKDAFVRHNSTICVNAIKTQYRLGMTA